MQAFTTLLSNATADELIRQAEFEGVRPEYLVLMIDSVTIREKWGCMLDDSDPDTIEDESFRSLMIARTMNSPTIDDVDEAVEEFTDFFDGCVRAVEEYGGRWPAATPCDILPIVQEVFQQADEWKTALINLREWIKNGESLETLASLIPDSIGT